MDDLSDETVAEIKATLPYLIEQGIKPSGLHSHCAGMLTGAVIMLAEEGELDHLPNVKEAVQFLYQTDRQLLLNMGTEDILFPSPEIMAEANRMGDEAEAIVADNPDWELGFDVGEWMRGQL